MHIVVFSDSHGSFHVLRRVVECQPNAEAFLHLGDGERDVDDLRALYPEKRIHFVAGNCDLGSLAREEEILTFAGKRIFLTHGHLYEVKDEPKKIAEAGKKLGADIICFGHTHTPFASFVDGVYLLNPGAISAPRGGGRSYGLIDITQAGIVLNIAEIKGDGGWTSCQT